MSSCPEDNPRLPGGKPSGNLSAWMKLHRLLTLTEDRCALLHRRCCFNEVINQLYIRAVFVDHAALYSELASCRKLARQALDSHAAAQADGMVLMPSYAFPEGIEVPDWVEESSWSEFAEFCDQIIRIRLDLHHL